MQRIKLLMIFHLTSISLYTQHTTYNPNIDRCSGNRLINNEKVNSFSTYKDYTASNFTLEQKRNFSKFKDLIPLEAIFSQDDFIKYKIDDNRYLTITVRDTIIKYNNFELFLYSSDSIFQNIIGNKSFSGIYEKNDSTIYFNYITKIDVIDSKSRLIYSLPKSNFRDLININLNTKYRTFRPVSCFMNKKNKDIYLYISGNGKNNKFIPNNTFPEEIPGFLTKIVYNQSKNQALRIFAPGYALYAFGWLWCEDFWPF